MKGYPTIFPFSEHVKSFYEAGLPVYMIDFEQEDQRNVCRRITHESMITREKLESRKVLFVLLEGGKGEE